MDDRSRELIYLELAKLVQAGFGIREAVRMVRETGVEREQEEFLEKLAGKLEAGEGLAAAMSDENDPVVGEMELAVVKAGEQVGQMGPALENLADHFGLQVEVKREVKRSLAYPLFLLHLGLLVGAIPMGEQEGGVGLLSGMMSRFVVSTVVVWLLIGGLWFLFRYLRCRARGASGMDRFLNRLPLFGKARSRVALARFTGVYHSCLSAGLGMHETVELALRSSDSQVLHEEGKELKEALSRGECLGPALQRMPVVPRAFARSYITAEQAGSLDQDLARWSEVFRDEAVHYTKRIAVYLPKIIFALIALLVVWRVVSFYLSYLSQLEKMI